MTVAPSAVVGLVLGATLAACASTPSPRAPRQTPASTAQTAVIDGAAVYAHACRMCHGPDGRGGTRFAGAAAVPDFSAATWQAPRAPEAIAAAVRDGVPGGRMPAFRDRLTPAEIDAVAAYVKSLEP